MSRLTQPASDKRAIARASARLKNRPSAWKRWMRPLARIGGLATPLVVIGTGVGWAWANGWLGAVGDSLSATLASGSSAAGFGIVEVLVEGRRQTDQGAILAALDFHHGDPILSYDLERARTVLERLPWVVSATVERRLPDTLFVRLTERRPLALWQRSGHHVLIDRDGTVLDERSATDYPGLPILVGATAPAHAQELMVLLDAEPALKARVDAAIRVGDRRWDLRLDNGITIRLPEINAVAALRRLAELEVKAPMLDRNIVAIDLRLPDRLIVQSVAAVPEPGPNPPAGQRPRKPERKT